MPPLKTLVSMKGQSIFGVISVPGDKSISHRALMMSAIAFGKTTIHGFLSGEDCLATLNALKLMGVEIDDPIEQRVVIQGVGKYGLKAPRDKIDCGNSGTTMRLLAGLLVGQDFESVLVGDASLMKRPMSRITLPLSMMGADIQSVDGHAPLVIRGRKSLVGIKYTLPIASAQVKSCLLLAGLYATTETEVIEPHITRDHTERMLTAFSYPITKTENSVVLNSLSQCLSTEIYIPGDISSAAFFIVAATLIEGSELYIRQVGINPTRLGVIQILKKMRADITILNRRLFGEELVADILVKYAPLEGIEIPSPLVPIAIDEFPILFVAAAVAKGQTTLRNAHELRNKESDRIEAMVQGLTVLGVESESFEDGIVIHGGELNGGVVDSLGDHRVAMAFAIAGTIAKSPVIIKNCENIVTSFPSFLQTAENIHLNIREHHEFS